MIRVVNLMIELSSTVNLHRRRWTSYEPDALRPVYILEKNQNVNRMRCHPVYNSFQNVNRMGCIRFTFSKWKYKPEGVPFGLHFKKIVNRMEGIRFSNFFF